MSNDSTAGCPKCAGLAACWCPPLSPIALDVSAIRWGIDQHDQENRIAPALVAKLHLLCAEVEQLRALVARVAQEEREKARIELYNEFWNASQDETDSMSAARLGMWLTSTFDKLNSRGTP